MAFDAGMVAHVARQLYDETVGGRIEKIYQPQKNEVIFSVRRGGENKKILVDVGSSNARINLSSVKTDNPTTPPMFCMMLRKHFAGAKITDVCQLGFERAIRITCDAYDEMGFSSHKHLIVEIMGTYSNLILTDAEDRIIGAAKQIDFSTSSKRQIIAGMRYELPPAQNKLDPLAVDRDRFNALAASTDENTTAEKFIISNFSGIAPVAAREIAYLSCGDAKGDLYDCRNKLTDVFFSFIETVKNVGGKPYLVYLDKSRPLDYYFIPLAQYGEDAVIEELSGFGELIDRFFSARAESERLHHRASDVQRILSNAEKRITKKLAILHDELASCDEGEKYKVYGDLVTANIYRIKKGDESVIAENYYDGMKKVEIKLDTRYTPAQNAQKFYKKYSKLKSAREHLTEQIAIAEREYEYIVSVAYALGEATGEREIAEIRTELHESGYASRMRGAVDRRKVIPSYTKYRTSGGFELLCGKNNLANDHITFKIADRSDWWFHVKGQPGSHVVMRCPAGAEPSELDFTEAATVAAANSKAADMTAVEVDYTKVKYVKKPAASKPGYVIYHTNYSTRVAADRAAASKMLVK
ncbi:MAG: NFACT family protein [Clostridia bacterium]|nr:NFACT family protein [Clostridia bacterium]